MPKIKDIVEIEKEETVDWNSEKGESCRSCPKQYNQGQSDLGDRAIELDGNKMRDIMIDELAKAPFEIADEIAIKVLDIIKRFKQVEGDIIVEVKNERK